MIKRTGFVTAVEFETRFAVAEGIPICTALSAPHGDTCPRPLDNRESDYCVGCPYLMVRVSQRPMEVEPHPMGAVDRLLSPRDGWQEQEDARNV